MVESNPGQDFNPRTHEGYDQQSVYALHPVDGFNPRTHEGYDLISTAINMVFQNFNPRAHEGYDFCLSYSIRYVTALIPVPVKGTIIALHILKNWQVF